MAHTKKKVDKNVIEDTEKELKTTISSDFTNDVKDMCENREDVQKKKKRKEKRSVTDKFQNSDQWFENSLNTVLIPEEMTFEKKQAKKNISKHTSEESDLTIYGDMTNNGADVAENQEHVKKKKKKRKKEKQPVTDEFQNSDTWFGNSLSEDSMTRKQKQKKEKNKNVDEELNTTILPHIINDAVDSSENQEGIRKEKNRKKEKSSVTEKWIENPLDNVLMSEDNRIYEKKQKKKKKENFVNDTNEDLDNTIPEVVDLCEDETSNRKKKKNRKNFKSDELKTDQNIANFVELSRNSFDTGLISGNNNVSKKNCYVAEDDEVEEERGTKVIYSSDHEENRFDKKKKRKKENLSIPHEMKNPHPFLQALGPGSKSLPGISPITKGSKKKKSKCTGNENTPVCTQQEFDGSIFPEQTREVVCLSSDNEDYSASSKKKKRKKDNITTDMSMCEKEKNTTIYNAKNVVQDTETGRTNRSFSKEEEKIYDLSDKKELVYDSPKYFKKDSCGVSKENNFDVVVSPTPFPTHELDFDEDPVNFHVPELHAYETIYRFSEEQKDSLKSNGVAMKFGKWSKFEDDLLRRNYSTICARYGINDPCLLLGLGQMQRNMEVMKFLKAKHFYVRLAKDLKYRPLRSVYLRARILFDPLRAAKKCKEEDVSTLKNAHARIGNKWHVIGGMMEKNNVLVRESFRWNEKPVKKGRWTPEEEQSLINAVKTVAQTDKLSPKLIKTISWEAVAKLVPTRNFSQCRLHYGEKMVRSPNVTQLSVWDRSCDAKLVEVLKNKRYNDATEIDWEDIHRSFEEVAPSYMFLQKKWRALKLKHKLVFLRSNYREIIKLLAEIYSNNIL